MNRWKSLLATAALGVSFVFTPSLIGQAAAEPVASTPMVVTGDQVVSTTFLSGTGELALAAEAPAIPEEVVSAPTATAHDMNSLYEWTRVVDSQLERGVLTEQEAAAEFQLIETEAKGVLGYDVTIQQIRNWQFGAAFFALGPVLYVVAGIMFMISVIWLSRKYFAQIPAVAWQGALIFGGVALGTAAAPLAGGIGSSLALTPPLALFIKGCLQFLGVSCFAGGLTWIGEKLDVESWLVPGILTAIFCSVLSVTGFNPFMGFLAVFALASGLTINKSISENYWAVVVTLLIGVPFTLGGLALKASVAVPAVYLGFQSGLLYVGAAALLGGGLIWTTKWYLQESRGNVLISRSMYLPLQAASIATCLAIIAWGTLFAVPYWSLMGALALSVWLLLKYAEAAQYLKSIPVILLVGAILLAIIGFGFVKFGAFLLLL